MAWRMYPCPNCGRPWVVCGGRCRRKNEDLENYFKECEEKISKQNKEKEELFGLKQFVDASLSNVDMNTLERKNKEITEEGLNIKKQIEEIEIQINNIGELDFSDSDYNALIEKREELTNTIAKIKADIHLLKNQITALEKAEFCPTCGQKLVNVDNSERIKENQEKINNLISVLHNEAINGEKKNDHYSMSKTYYYDSLVGNLGYNYIISETGTDSSNYFDPINEEDRSFMNLQFKFLLDGELIYL